MKKAILCITLTAAFSTSTFALEASSEAVVQNLNGSQQVIKIYTLPPGGDPQESIEEPFVLEGYLYTFADIVKTENRADDTRAKTEAVTIETVKNDLGLILGQLAPTIDHDDGQYQGTLALDYTTIRTEAAGYTTKSYMVTTAKTIGPVDRNDTSYIPATTVKDGCTLNLSNVEWQVTGTESVDRVLMPSSYQTMVTYSRAASYSTATGYVITIDCAGEVSRDEAGSVTYQLTYLGEADVSIGSEDGSQFLPVFSTRWSYILGGVGSVALLILVTLLLRSRRETRYLRSEQESILPEDDDEEEEFERETDSAIP